MAAVPTESLELTVDKDTGRVRGSYRYTGPLRKSSSINVRPILPFGSIGSAMIVKGDDGLVNIEDKRGLVLHVGESEEYDSEPSDEEDEDAPPRRARPAVMNEGYSLFTEAYGEVRISAKLATAVLEYLNAQAPVAPSETPVTQSVKFVSPDFKPQITGVFVPKAEQKASAQGLATVSAFNPRVPRELVEGKMADFLGLPKTKKAGKRRGSRRTKKRSTRRRGRRSM